ncbi:efflux RND transporter periplasmic adaptor subunit [Azospirillum argentinense]|uniref:Efflux RND transporter periplasmic adaptor subunit n=1 Tax=Azospirillum argentinense TaxID=2970906 RepID=A0ABW8VFP3_9PROT
MTSGPSDVPDRRMRLSWRRAAFLAASAGVAAVAVVGSGVWSTVAGPADSGQPRIVVVTAKPLVSRISVVGVVEPGTTVNVVAPFDGSIKEKRFEYGGHVGHGAVLLVMDTAELDVRLREAQVGLLRASRAVDELKGWAAGAEVSRARRGVAAAKLALDDSRRKAAETRLLLDQGIVPRMEWETQVQQTATLKIQLEAAEQELKTVLDRGGQSHREIAELELKNAQARVAEYQEQRDRTAIEAPVSGIILRPIQTPSSQALQPPLDIGARLSRGQSLFTVADLERLVVTAKVDEADINRLRVGQAVEVTGESFGNAAINGRIAHVSAQALPPTSGQGALFEIKVDITPTDEQAQRMRVGMSSVVTIMVYEKPNALVVSPEALSKDGQGPFVMVLDPRTEQPRKTRVTLGRPTEDGVEVLDGLQEKDRLVVR